MRTDSFRDFESEWYNGPFMANLYLSRVGLDLETSRSDSSKDDSSSFMPANQKLDATVQAQYGFDQDVQKLLFDEGLASSEVEAFGDALYERVRRGELVIARQLINGIGLPDVDEERKMVALETIASAQLIELEELVVGAVQDFLASRSAELRFSAVACMGFLGGPKRTEMRNVARWLAGEGNEPDEDVREAARAFLRHA